jgi:hypothetical protein
MNPMRKRSRNLASQSDDFVLKPRKVVPHQFVLDALAELSPYTRPMFGCVAIYVQDKIVLILREKPASAVDNGVWLATTCEHHESLRSDFPNMRSISVLGKDVTGWQVLPADAPDFEQSALRACELVIARDSRIGKVPKRRSRSAAPPKSGRKTGARKQSSSKGVRSRVTH